jgi:hypothetical protein
MELGPCVPKARAYIFKMPDVRAVMGLQDMWGKWRI